MSQYTRMIQLVLLAAVIYRSQRGLSARSADRRICSAQEKFSCADAFPPVLDSSIASLRSIARAPSSMAIAP